MSQTQNIASSGKLSLKHKLMQHVLWPLGLVWLLGTLLSAGIANYFVQQAFDRSLLDDAYMVASHVNLKVGQSSGLDVNISQAELQSLLFDQSEVVAFALFREDGSLLAGHPGLTTPAISQRLGNAIVFENIVFQGNKMRSVVLHQERPEKFSVVVAQTAMSRTLLLEKLLTYSVIPEVLLLILIGAWLRWTIDKDLQPLTQLIEVVQTRDGADFSPLQVKTNNSDIVNLGDAVNSLLRRIEAGLSAQKEFTGNVAHELRTPLAGIRALAEYGLESTQPDLLKTQLTKIRESSIRASHLTDQLLALALADEAGIEMKTESVQLDEVITAAILQRSALARELRIDLGAMGVESTTMVLANKALVEGILNNLLDNAIRYGKPLDAQMQVITVALQVHHQGVEMVVQDNGPGIPTQDIDRILQRGVQGTQAAGVQQGLGLGLSIVKRYAELLGVQFWLQNGATEQGLEAHVLFRTQ